MSRLSDFLHPESVQEEKEVVISNRFVRHDENGNVLRDGAGNPVLATFRIRAISQEENDKLIKAATTTYRDRTGNKVSSFDRFKYSHSMVIAGTVDPDLRSKELCEQFGVLDPEIAVTKMLLTGEYKRLADAIAELSGIGEDIEEEAKN